MIYVEAPDVPEVFPHRSVFLAGGITNCPDWQQGLRRLLEDSDLMLINPRRKNFPRHDPLAAKAQIAWEYRMLRQASMLSFWFPKETLCPIVLYELGAWAHSNKPIFVGCHPEYPRRQDVVIQLSLVCPLVCVVERLEDLAWRIMGKELTDLDIV